jgi:Autotransporter beta-domain
MRISPRSTLTIATLITAFGLPASADDLETTCEDNSPTSGTYLCATALEFGGQAALLRDLFLGRHHGATPGDTGFTASTSGVANAYTGVFSAGAQVTGGNFSGNMQALVLGADRSLSDGSFLGVMLQFGQSTVTAPGSPRVDRREVLIGPYFAGDFGNELYLDGYLLFGQPDYTIANVPTNGESITGSVTLSKGLQTNGMNHVLYASLSMKQEEPSAAQDINAAILTLGGSLRSEDRRITNGWRQNFARLEVDFGSYEDNLGTGTIRYVAPRITLGTDIAFDNDASFNLSANASLASDQTYILGLRAAYNLRF